jgi:hypothetical protein
MRVESNAGWRLYAMELRNRINDTIDCTDVAIFNQKLNKEVRIYDEAPTIRRLFHFKNGCYEEAMRDMFAYMKLVKDQKDDFVDCLAEASRYFKKNNLIDF